MTSRHSQRRDLLTAGPGLELIEIGLGDLLELTGEAFGVNDLRPERDSAPHGRLVGGEARARGSGELRQTGEAADEPGDVGQAELAVGGEEVLEGLAYGALVDSEDQDPVVGEEPLLDGLAESEAMKLLTEVLGVVNRSGKGVGLL